MTLTRFSSHLKPGSSLFSSTGLAGSQAFASLGKIVCPFHFTSRVRSTSLKELKEQAGLQIPAGLQTSGRREGQLKL